MVNVMHEIMHDGIKDVATMAKYRADFARTKGKARYYLPFGGDLYDMDALEDGIDLSKFTLQAKFLAGVAIVDTSLDHSLGLRDF